jgi:L-lactate dehydrogenase (cytochrome)
MRGLDRCSSVAELRRLALRRLPWPVREFLEGGADDEWSLANNRAAFSRWALVPRALADVRRIDTRTKVLGCDLEGPVLLAPTGMSRLYHPGAEMAVARAAASAGTLYSLSTYSSQTLEEVAEASPGPKMFQLFTNPGWERSGAWPSSTAPGPRATRRCASPWTRPPPRTGSGIVARGSSRGGRRCAA